MEQPKKPGAPGARDITDLKARLGLNRGPAPGGPPGAPPRGGFPGGPGGPPPGGFPGGPGAPPQGGFQGGTSSFGAPAPQPFAPPPGMAPQGGPRPGPTGGFAAAGAAPAAHDPYAAMRPPAGRQFDLRPVDDGVPAANMRRGGFGAAVIIGLVLAVIGGVLGVGFGMTMSGRRAFNETNRAAKRVKGEIEEMHKTVTQIGSAVAFSQQRLQGEKKDRLSYDPKLIDELEKVKLDPRPDTSKIFKVDYFRLSDIAVDTIMSYYYDTISLYGEVERHVKKTRADKASLDAFAAKLAAKAQVKYGVVFAGGGKVAISNLVEMGSPVCKGGGSECGLDQLEGFQIRANAGANWVTRKVSSKPEGGTVVPIEPTPLFEAAMSGSPDQARMEQYKIRSANIQLLLARIAQTQKQLLEAINTAAARPDMFAL